MNSLLDDQNIESEIPTTLVQELKSTGRWLLMFMTLGIIGAFLSLIVTFNTWFGVVTIMGIFLTLFFVKSVYHQFQYARHLHWFDVHETHYSMEQLIYEGVKVWQYFSLFLVILIFLFGVIFWGISTTLVVEEPVQAIEKEAAIIESSLEVDTVKTVPVVE